MKNSLLVIIIFFSFSSFSQDYVPMLSEGKTWEMQRTTYMVPPDFTTEIIYFSYYIEGSEVINSEEYFILKNNANDYEPIHYLRENINEKIVYELITENLTEVVLFDFNSETNQEFVYTTFFMGMNICQENENTISAIELQSLYGINSKHFTLYYDGMDDETIAEGIGFTHCGFYNTLCSGASTTDLPEYSLLGMTPLNINDLSFTNNIPLFYNSIIKQLSLKNTKGKYHLQLFSILGEKVLNSQIDKSINVSYLKKGIYTYLLENKSSYSKGKVLIF